MGMLQPMMTECQGISSARLTSRPDGDDDCMGEVGRVQEQDGDVAAGDHVVGGDGSRGGDVLQPDAEAACDLDGGKVGV